MPYIKIQTNAKISNSEEVLHKLSALMAAELGKPEAYVMTAFDPLESMTFGGSSEPAVFIECKSIGLNKNQTAGLSSALCTFSNETLQVPSNRVYIEFTGAEGSMWGWDGRTF